LRRSKLELYENILRALVNKPLTVDAIAYACNMDCIALRQRLEFLLTNGLVEITNFRNTECFALTRRGIAIFSTLTITKRLEKLQTTIKQLDEALRAIPALSEINNEKPKRTRRNENY
jgi:predicted transcriptional regulator